MTEINVLKFAGNNILKDVDQAYKNIKEKQNSDKKKI